MDISVIIPIYKAEPYIERCLRSLFTQTKTDGVEFILVNDATPDMTMEIARRVIAEYPSLNSAIKIIENAKNEHIGKSIQTGLDNALGDYVIQIDNDDWCEPCMLEDMYAEAVKSDADIVYCDYFIKAQNSIERIEKQAEDSRNFVAELIDFNFKAIIPALWNKLIRRRLFASNNILVNQGGLYLAVDVFVSIRLFFYATNIVYLPSAYVHYNKENLLQETRRVAKYSYDERYKYIYLLEAFMRDNNCDVYNSNILQFKAVSKLVWVKENSDKRQRECISYFPEADNFILKSTNIPMTTKLPYFLIIKGFAPLGNLTTWLIKYGIRIKHSLERSIAFSRLK